MRRPSAVIVLQARMGSTRLPGKVLAPIGTMPLVAHCIRRLQRAAVGPVILATTSRDEDTALAEAGERLGVTVFRGSAEDVLGRYVEAAAGAEAEYVVRATGDNPAVDPGSVVRLMHAVTRGAVDHAVEAGLPYGATVEVMRFAALEKSASVATADYDREHVTPHLRRPASGFRCAILPAPTPLCRPDLRFTVDTPADLIYMRRVIAEAEAAAPGEPSLAALIAAADRVGVPREAA